MDKKSSLTGHSQNFLMKQHWTPVELIELWTLSNDEKTFINRKEERNKLVYALKMKYFDLYSCFPSENQKVPLVIMNTVAFQLAVKPQTITTYSWHKRSARAHNDEIRQYYGFHKLNQTDWLNLGKFIKNILWPLGLPMAHIYAEVYQFLKKEKIDPPPHQFLMRKINAICTNIEYQFFKNCSEHINADHLKRLLEAKDNEDAPLTFIRRPAGKICDETIDEEIKKLGYLTSTLYCDFFKTIPKKVLKKYYDIVATSSPYDLRKMDVAQSNALLSCFCYYKGAKILDNLIDIFIRRFSRLQKMAEAKAKDDLWKLYTTEDTDKQLLTKMVDISLENPHGVIEKKIYPGVGGKEKLTQSKLSRKSSSQISKEFEYTHLRSLYVHHHRKYIIEIIKNLKLGSTSNKPLCDAVDALLNSKPLVLTDILTKGILKAVENNPMYCELAVLDVLRKELKCKNVWVNSSLKHEDPEKDLPQDFKEKKQMYCQMLDLPEDGKELMRKVKKEMAAAIKAFNASIPTNEDVRIGKKSGKPHIFLTPYTAQDEPENITAIKQDILNTWPNTALLDIWKETDLRLGLTQALIAMTDKVALDPQILQQRLLLCIFAMGTNTEFKSVCTGTANVSESDLWYVKKRFITPEGLRQIIRKLVDNTIEVRDEEIWGNVLTHFSSDSVKISVWDGNLMSERHIRYNGYGVMAYWHVDKKALCIFGQLKRCSDSEVVSMLTGIIHHGTKAKVVSQSTDTHGQSFIAFAFSYLLGVELRPRIKGIGRMKINKPDQHLQKSSYNHIETVMGKPIKWALILKHYDQMLRYLVALVLRTAEPEVLLKRFIAENNRNTLYKAFLEFGRAICTAHNCRYFTIKESRIEVEEALNGGENWNSGNKFIFFGKRGVISSNDECEQEMSILSMHLLQSSLVYVNTLMVQRCIKKKKWKPKLTKEDKRAITALFDLHVNQYGLFPLDMTKRLNIDEEE